MENKIKEVQEYLHERGIDVAETTIVNMAIEIVERLGEGYYPFACFELEERLKKREEEKEK